MRKVYCLPILFLLILCCGKSFSQVTLSGTSYTESFNSLGSGLPAGFTVRTGASASSLGTAQALATAATAWNNTSGAFKNFASANGLLSSASASDQLASPDRALGVRQTGTFGDPGSAFTFQISNTTGFTNLHLGFKLQSLDASSQRTTTWLVQYGIGTSPSSFTTVTTVPSPLTTGNLSFVNTSVFVDFGTTLDNQAQNVWIRIVALTASTGSNNRASSAIDDFSLTYSAGGTVSPSISISPSSLTGFSTTSGTASTSQSFTASGSNLTDNISISPSGAYEVSTDNTTFSSSLTLNQIGGTVSNTTVYVRIKSSASPGAANGTVSLTSGTASNSLSLAGSVIGLINLATSPYVQNFNGIGTGLPTGVTVRTAAGTSLTGTEAAFATAPTAWNNTGGGFKNFASGNNDQGVIQSTATDRALGVRQVTATDPGAAFVFQIANTTGKINFTLDFNLQSLDVSSTRITTWRVDYGFGSNPSSFIVPTTTGNLTTGGNTFSNNPIHVDFGNAMDNQTGVVTIRIVSLIGSSGSGNRASTGIDDFTLTWEDPTAKTFSLNTTAINFPLTNIGNNNTASYKIVSQTNLDQPINIVATAPYTISTDNANYVSTLSVAPADALNKTIYVRFAPTSAGVYSGTITHTSEGAASKIVNLSAEAVDPNALTFNFNTCSVSNIPGSGFLSINITGAQKWKCSQFGRNGTNGVDVNGFANGAAQTNDAWLISPPLNLNNIVNLPVLSFYSRGEFTGSKLQLYVSTTYDGNSIPNLADWAELNGNFPTPPGSATTAWTFSDNIDLSAYKAAPKVYIAFRYTSSAALNAARWSVDDVAITDQSTLLTVNPTQLNFGEISVGSNSASQAMSLKAIGSTDLTLTAPAGYQISLDNNIFSTSAIVIDQATAEAGTTFYVRFSPVTKALKVEGSVHISAEGLSKDIVSVTGSSFPKSETFDVACYNISFFGAGSTNSATPEQIATQVGNVSTVMQKLNADVIGIEEMSNDDALGQLVATLPGYSSVVSNRWSYSFNPPDPTFPPQKIGFIYNTATMALSTEEPPRVMFESLYDSARLNLPGHRLTDYPTGTPSSFWASGRLPFMATFNATVDGVSKKVRVIVIHAKSGGDNDGYIRRQYDAKLLKDSLDAFYGNDKVIIVGDYNDRMVTSIYTGHVSSYQPFVDDIVNYDILTKPLDVAGKTSFPGDAGMIDHITVSNDLVNEYIANSTDIEDPRSYIANYNSVTASDHLPVFSRYQFCKLTAPSNISVSNDQGQCGAIVSFNASATMTCGTVTGIPASGSFFPIGTTTVKLTASTGDTASFTVTVTDDEKPVVTAPADVTASSDEGQCGTVKENVSLGDALYSDNCPGTTITNDAPAVFSVGTTIVTWTATDAHGNSSTATQKVVVEDHELPGITAPAGITTNSDAGNCSAVVALGTAQTSDNCAVASVTNNAPSNGIFTVGTHTVTWTVTDVHGNTNTATQTVTVNDNENPTITAPAAISVNADAGKCYATRVILGTAQTGDNCGVQTVSNDAPTEFPVGSTTVTWTVTDIHGNTATATQAVAVSDNEKPIITAPSALTVHPNNAGCTAKNVALGTPTTSDNCGVQSVINNAPLTYAVGTTTVTWTVTDIHGNISTATQAVTVTVDPAMTSSIPDVYAVKPGGTANTIYIGYGPSSVTLNAVVSGGAGGYSYKWTLGSSAGPALNNTASYTVSPTSATTYYFNVKDMYGCSAPVTTKTVYVTDVRCGAKMDKVTVCSTIKGKFSATCLMQKDVSGALSSGSYLGTCTDAAVTTKVISNRSLTALLNISAMPNPSANYFTIDIEGGNASEEVILQVTDALGRVVEQKTNLQSNSKVQIGSNYKRGIYLVQVIQGTAHKEIKLVKL